MSVFPLAKPLRCLTLDLSYIMMYNITLYEENVFSWILEKELYRDYS